MLRDAGLRVVLVVIAFMVALICPSSATYNTLSGAETRLGWKLLFDGETLDGWVVGEGTQVWQVEDGTITSTDGGAGVLHTSAQYSDFMLVLDFRIDKGASGGVLLRTAHRTDPMNTGIRMRIADSYGVEEPGKRDCGAIYDCLEPRENACNPPGEWNTVVIICRANTVRVVMNGKIIVSMDLNEWTEARKNPDGTANQFPTAYRDMPGKGYIGLQHDGGRMWFRNIKLRTLDRPTVFDPRS